ncbi:hypothetical protein N7468_008796 [Penicillium chermesinum]|uniref:Uncharacterized protein n=1 Tax=Penicillium chermesinum TaxID=63820 RepID=A0A9W9NGP9_9EURO|nr:uncharacterized protein N7468_008796 [Penicillium chermesinum]KAJ5219592.1 hypothetical protein N7468_008796 [Penicillium chermesinum]
MILAVNVIVSYEMQVRLDTCRGGHGLRHIIHENDIPIPDNHKVTAPLPVRAHQFYGATHTCLENWLRDELGNAEDL